MRPVRPAGTSLLGAAAEAALARGAEVRFAAGGVSMLPALLPGDVVTVAPVRPAQVRRGDVVLYRDEGGRPVLHRVVGVVGPGRGSPGPAGLWVRGDAPGGRREWVAAGSLAGRMVSVRREGREWTVSSRSSRYSALGRVWATLLARSLRAKAATVRAALSAAAGCGDARSGGAPAWSRGRGPRGGAAGP